MLLSQVGNMEPGILSLIGNGVTIIVLAYYVIYDVRVRTPAMFASFESGQEKLRVTFSEEQSSSHEHYNKVIDGLRSTFASEQASTRNAFLTEQAVARDRYDKELSEMRRMLIENLTAMRTAVHDVKDTANNLILDKKATAAETQRAVAESRL